MSDLVGNPEDRFSRVEAQLMYVHWRREVFITITIVNLLHCVNPELFLIDLKTCKTRALYNFVLISVFFFVSSDNILE